LCLQKCDGIHHLYSDDRNQGGDIRDDARVAIMMSHENSRLFVSQEVS
jgi:hypothetical protein